MAVCHLNVLPFAQLPRPHGFLLPPRLLPTEHVELSLRAARFKVVSPLFAFDPVFFQDTEEFHHL